MKKTNANFQPIESNVYGVAWPPLAVGMTASLATLMHQLEMSQWLPAEEIREKQLHQIAHVAMHAERYSPYFKKRLQAVQLHAQQLASFEGISHLPVMTRRDLQAAGKTLFCRQIPEDHLPMSEVKTSGSSGEPVMVKRTTVNQLFWLASALRDHIWHKRDFSGSLAVIRFNYSSQAWHGVQQEDWGVPASLFFKTGAMHKMEIDTDIKVQAEWLAKINPDYLLTYPNTLLVLIDYFKKNNITLDKLRGIRTISETLHDDLRELARDVLQVEITDMYSSQELGVIAIQCPDSGLYHTMAESHFVEVLDEHGALCKEGEVGRIVVTDLHNFATPLIRYEIGDYAEVGSVCPCGRGLPTLKRIVGRSRNLVRHPDGKRHWPVVGFAQYQKIAPIRQFQMVQRTLDTIEVRLVSDTPLSANQELKLTELICTSLHGNFSLNFVYFPKEIPRTKGGKFEEFICEV